MIKRVTGRDRGRDRDELDIEMERLREIGTKEINGVRRSVMNK